MNSKITYTDEPMELGQVVKDFLPPPDQLVPKGKIKGFFGLSYAMNGVIRNAAFIEKDIQRFLSIFFALERTNQLSVLPDKDLVYLCHPIEPYQVTKNR